MNGKTLYRETKYLRAFPDPSAVFANRVTKHSAFLLPAATLSLRYLSRKCDGLVHSIMPIEPCGGYGAPADQTTRYHNYLCRPNWIGYLLAAIAALKGHTKLGRALEHLQGICGRCARCGALVFPDELEEATSATC